MEGGFETICLILVILDEVQDASIAELRACM